MWKPSKNSALPHRRASALAAALAVALPGTAPAVTSDVDYVLRPFPGAAPVQQQERRLRVLDVQPGRVVPKFEFLYDAPAKWPGALHWRYNGGNVPASLGGNKDAAIQHIVDASAKWTAACGVQIVYDGETTHAPNALIDGRADKLTVVGWQTPEAGNMGATYAWFDTEVSGDRTLVDSDIALSPVAVTSLPQLDLIVTHEWGHAIGLGHSNVGNALMSGPPQTAYFAITGLTPDDVHACRCLYGPPAGQQAGSLCALPKVIDFGALPVRTGADPKQVIVTNDGDAALTITGIRTGTSEFLVGPHNCPSGAALAPGSSCTFAVGARPANLGPRSDEVTIETSDGPYRIPLRANGVAAALPAASNFDGLWWSSPAGSESGWGINFAHQGDVIFVTWFTYGLDGKAWWLTMTATKTAEEVYRGTIYQTRGPAFNATPFRPAAVTATPVGIGTLTFTDADNGSFSYTVNGTSQVKPITRQVFGPLPDCVFGAQADLTTATNFQDIWYAAPAESEAGWGVNFTHQGDTIFATWFSYDFDGAPLWLAATAPRIGTHVFSGILYRTTGPAFSATPFNPGDVVRTPVGTMTLTFLDGNDATFEYTVTLGTPPTTVSQTKQLTRLVFRAPGTVCK